MTTVVASSIVLLVVAAILGLAGYLWYGLALSVVFPRLGSASWKGWVPVVNEAEILARGGVPAWSVVYYFIPLVQFYGLYLKITAVHRINGQFHRGAGSTVLAILLPPVWATLLAWGKQPTSEFDQRVSSMLPSSSDAGVGPLAGSRTASAPSGPPPARDASGYLIPPPTHPIAPEAATSATAATPAAPAIPAAPEMPMVALVPPPAPPSPSPAVVVAAVEPGKPTTPERPATASGFIVNPWAKPETEAPDPVAAVPVPVPVPAPTPAPAPASGPADDDDTEDRPPAVIVSVLPTLTSTFAEPVAGATTPGDHDLRVDEPDEDEDEYAETVVVDRRPKVSWTLQLDNGKSFPLTSDRVALGRNPASEDPDTQLLPVPDSTRTLSKSHATLTLADGEWIVTDLNSTNGVIVVADDDAETLLAPGRSAPVPGRFILGKVGMRVASTEGGGA